MAADETTPLLASPADDQSSTNSNDGAEKSNTQLSRAQMVGLVSAISGIIIAQADGSIALSIHEPIASQFDSLEYSSWMITGFTIGYCVTLPLYGQLSDTYGRQRPLISAYCLFCIGCFFSAVGQSYWQVVLGRLIAGCGGSGMISLVAIIIIDIAPPAEVAIWRSYVTVASVVGHSLGGPIGGFLAETIGWRWSFMGQVPIAILCCLSTYWSLRSLSTISQQEALTEDEIDAQVRPTLWDFDFAGAITLAISITSLLGVIDLKNKLGWESPLIIVAVAAGTISTAIFLVVESTRNQKPLIPLSLFGTQVGLFCLTTFLVLGGRLAFVSHIAPYFIRTQGASDAEAGAFIAPSSIGNAVGAIIAGQTLKRFGSYKKLSILALAGSILASTLVLLRWNHKISIWEAFEVFLPGLFAGMIFSLQFIGLSLSAPKEHIATAVSLYYMSQQVGIATGVSLTSSLMMNKFEGALEGVLASVPNHRMIVEEVLRDYSFTLSLSDEIRSLIRQCYLSNFWVVPAVYITTQVVALIPMLSTTDRTLS